MTTFPAFDLSTELSVSENEDTETQRGKWPTQGLPLAAGSESGSLDTVEVGVDMGGR